MVDSCNNHQTPDCGCRSRQTSLSLALVDQERHISPSEAFTDICQPEHLVASVPDTVSRRENTTALTGILVLSFTLLPGLLGAHSYCPSLCQAAQATPLWWGTRLSFLHVILHKATDTVGSGSLRNGHKRASLHARCGSVRAHPTGQGQGRHCLCDQKRLQRQVDTMLLQCGGAPTANRAVGSYTAQINKTIPRGSRVHSNISARIKAQVSKNGVSL